MLIFGSERQNTIKKLIKFSPYKNTAAILCCAVFFVFTSCDDAEVKDDSKQKTNFASEIIFNANIIQHDSGRVSLRFKAPIIEKFSHIDSPYVVAKKGIYLEYFDKKKPEIPGKIWANHAIMFEKKNFYEAKGDVKILTNEGTSFATQTIFWDRNKKKMYTKDTVFVRDNVGRTLIGVNGMIANDDFSEYTFYNNHGEMPTSGDIPKFGK